ncbi:hypothetical protein CAMRE0001_0754 [Campylobacter rectus RM3267]|uniref:Uncharacterized protein n=1 Tax=Campylobacter rectus RM3267 TaxID=553218 RepID=B9CZR2_CAMRE|nr:hypothetical protein CAMRE0001_0754 [Campylobacter rectus RM3267]
MKLKFTNLISNLTTKSQGEVLRDGFLLRCAHNAKARKGFAFLMDATACIKI